MPLAPVEMAAMILRHWLSEEHLLVNSSRDSSESIVYGSTEMASDGIVDERLWYREIDSLNST